MMGALSRASTSFNSCGSLYLQQQVGSSMFTAVAAGQQRAAVASAP
jgi:hypothetical protein